MELKFKIFDQEKPQNEDEIFFISNCFYGIKFGIVKVEYTWSNNLGDQIIYKNDHSAEEIQKLKEDGFEVEIIYIADYGQPGEPSGNFLRCCIVTGKQIGRAHV